MNGKEYAERKFSWNKKIFEYLEAANKWSLFFW
jgi:hypothetical protein